MPNWTPEIPKIQKLDPGLIVVDRVIATWLFNITYLTILHEIQLWEILRNK